MRVQVRAKPQAAREIPILNGIMAASSASPGRQLRDAWNAGPIALPGVFNPLVAKMAERIGFRAVYLSGGALSAGNGVPDIGLLTLTEFVSTLNSRHRRRPCQCSAMRTRASANR